MSGDEQVGYPNAGAPVALTFDDACILVRGMRLGQRALYLEQDAIDAAWMRARVKLRGVQLDMWGYDETA